MNQAAGFHLYDKEESIQAFQLRSQFKSQQLSSENVTNFLERLHKEEEEYLAKFKYQPIGFLNVLGGVEQWLEDKGSIKSKVKTCAQTMLQTGAAPIMRQSVSNFNKGKINTFVTYYDYSEGMMEVVSAILGAINVIEGTEQEKIDEASIRWLQYRKVMPVGVIDIFNLTQQEEYRYFAKILKEDPTGLSVVSEIVRELKEELAFKVNNQEGFPYPRILSYQYPQLYVAGAEFGKRIYENLYALWEKEGTK